MIESVDSRIYFFVKNGLNVEQKNTKHFIDSSPFLYIFQLIGDPTYLVCILFHPTASLSLPFFIYLLFFFKTFPHSTTTFNPNIKWNSTHLKHHAKLFLCCSGWLLLCCLYFRYIHLSTSRAMKYNNIYISYRWYKFNNFLTL